MAVHAQGGVRPVVVRALASHVHLRSAPAGHHRADARRAEAAHRHQVPREKPHRFGRQPHELEARDRARRDQRRCGARAELRAREGGGVRPHPRAGQLGDDRSALRIIRGARPSIPSPSPPPRARVAPGSDRAFFVPFLAPFRSARDGRDFPTERATPSPSIAR